MKIRTRLAARFAIIVASLLILFATSVYYFSSTYRKKEFYERLTEKANNYAQLLIKLDKSNPDLIKIFDRNTAYLPNENIIVYDGQNKLLFKTVENSDTVNLSFLNRVRVAKEMRFTVSSDEVLAMVYQDPHYPFVVLVSAYDKYGLYKLHNLKIILITGLFFCILITVLAGWIYAGRALSPISGVITQVDKMSVANLAQRVEEGNGKDEIAQMAMTFNRLLDRIQNSFELQKSFVSNSSHEFRTPLTAITGQLEVALMSNKTAEEYKNILNSVLEDINNLSRLTNGLLELAQADMDISKLQIRPVRMDELLWHTRSYILKRRPKYTINIDIKEFPNDESKLVVHGSEQLLRSAIMNVIDNACKFSENTSVNIVFRGTDEFMEISFTDAGIGISQKDIQNLSQPFYRAGNAKSFPGHGLGLSLTYKIVHLYGGKISIASEVGKYTRVTMFFN
ncbi:MAG: ATP-binding protein [Bacteroidia bacterium]